MNVISLERYAKSKLITLFLLLCCLTINAQVTLKIGEIIEQQGDQVTVSVTAYNFSDIIGMQFSINWDSTLLKFLSVNDLNLVGLTQGQIGFPPETATGDFSLVWYDEDVSGESVPDGTSIFSITFQRLSNKTAYVAFSDLPTLVEFTGVDENPLIPLLCYGVISNNTITGQVFHDQDLNCALEPGEMGLEGWIILASGVQNYYARSDKDGRYQLPVEPGAYELTIFPPNDYWGFCDGSYQVMVDNFSDTVSLNIPAQTLIQCPLLEVDVSTTLLRRCFDNTYTVRYCNRGTATAENAFVEVNFDSTLQVLGSDLPWISQDGDIYTFHLGDIDAGACGTFYVTVQLPCDEVTLGQTHCVSAKIFPDSLCTPPNPSWSGASIVVDGFCDEGADSVRFSIQNIGDEPMPEPAQYIVVEDAVMYSPKSFSLDGGETREVTMPATGATFRLETEQVAGHPLADQPSVSIEGCTEESTDNFSVGYVNQFPLNDVSPFFSIDCRENVGSFDPNEKLAFPKGALEPHYIRPNTDLEYIVRFQNTGTDLAYNVLIRDTLSSLLDITHIQPGASSHPYRMEITNERELLVFFDDIMLPDSNTNEPASHGFVKFRIPQLANNPLGSIIENRAAIYFDFNDPVITQTSFHTIGENFLEIVSTPTAPKFEVKIDIYPNPFSETVVFSIDGPLVKDADFLLYRANGQLLQQIAIENNQWELRDPNLPAGWYSYQIIQNNRSVGQGKLIKH